jgi:hypothetical protein
MFKRPYTEGPGGGTSRDRLCLQLPTTRQRPRRMHYVGQTMVPTGERPPNGSHSGAHVRLLYLLPQCGRHSCSQARLNPCRLAPISFASTPTM